MPLPEPTPPSPDFLKNPWALIAGLVTLITSLIAYIVHGFKSTQECQQDQIGEGAKEFVALRLENEKLRANIEALRKWNKELERDIDEIEKELGEHHDFIIKIKERHKSIHGDEL